MTPTSIMEMCDEVLYLDNGKIQIIGEPAMVASAYQQIAG
jgi:ABC-type polysaccharide/polyol phosphate transport system ATPase subunit